MTQSTADFAGWSADAYLQHYYGAVEVDEAATLHFLAKELARIGPVGTALEFGSGPTLHHVLPLAPYADAIDMADPLRENLAAVRRWIAGRSDAHDWRAFTRHVLACEGRPVGGEAVRTREALTRRRVRRLLHGDAAAARPLGTVGLRYYDIVLSCFCADSATGNKATWARYLRRIGELVAPGGRLLLASLRRCRAYRVGERSFPSADVDETDIASRLREIGFDGPSLRIEVEGVPLQHRLGYNGIVLASATRRTRRTRMAHADVPSPG